MVTQDHIPEAMCLWVFTHILGSSSKDNQAMGYDSPFSLLI